MHHKLTKHCEEIENRLSQLETEASDAKKLAEDKDEQLKIFYSIARQDEADRRGALVTQKKAKNDLKAAEAATEGGEGESS